MWKILAVLFLLVSEAHSRVFTVPFENIDNQITTNVSIGIPPQKFRLLVDFGETELFVLSTDCKQCKNRNLYNTTWSSWIKEYTHKSGYEAGINRIIYFVEKKLFSIYQEKSYDQSYNGLLTFGGHDIEHCQKDVASSFPLINNGEDGWKFESTSTHIDGQQFFGTEVLVDPNSDSFLVPSNIFAQLVKAFHADIGAIHYVDCEAPKIQIKIVNGPSTLTIPANLFIKKASNGMCYLAVYSVQFRVNTIVLSKRVLDNFCVSYNLDDKKVEFLERNIIEPSFGN